MRYTKGSGPFSKGYCGTDRRNFAYKLMSSISAKGDQKEGFYQLKKCRRKEV